MSSSGPERWPGRLRRALLEGDAAPPAPDAGRYELRGELGRGGMGVVHRAWDRQLNREVALKILREDAAGSVGAERFRREARVAAQLSHPNLVAVYDAGEREGRNFLVMELVDGRPLGEILGQPGLDRAVLLRIVERAARGVAAAHERGVVHRDLKPANILVTAAGEPKVADFGIAHLLEPGAALTVTGATLGTPPYMAPEQVGGRAKDISPRTDVYGLGAILYHVLVGRPPYRGESAAEIFRQILDAEPVPPRSIDPAIPRDLETIAMKALEKSPERRYAGADAFADDIARHLAGEPIAARPVPAPLRAWRAALKHRLALAGLAALALAGLVAVAASVAVREQDRRRKLERRSGAEAEALKLLEIARPALEKAEEAFYRADGDGAAAAAGVDDALKRLERTVALAPGLAVARYHLGTALELKGRDAEAEASWRKAIELDPSLAPAHAALGRLLALRSFVATVPSYRPNSPFDPETAARIADEAVAEFERAAKAGAPEDPVQRAVSDATSAYARRDIERVRSICAAAAKSVGTARGAERLHLLAGLVTPGDEGARAVDRAIEIRPKYPWALIVRAGLHAAAGRNAEAIEDCGRILAIDPRFSRALVQRGNIRQQLGQYDAAAADFSEMIRQDPEDRAAWFNRGNANRARRDWDGAIRDYGEAIRLMPFWEAPWLRRGLAKAEKGDIDGAIADTSESLRVNPDNLDAFLVRGRFRERLGEVAGAAADYETCVKRAQAGWAGLVEAEARLKALREH